MSSQRSPTSSSRSRNFTTIVYPESAPEDWLSILRSAQVPAVISPIHDKDIHDDGICKKPHYHVVLMYDSLKTIDQARELSKTFGGVGCEKVMSTRKMLRYLCHLDEIDKPKYDTMGVTIIGDIDYFGIIESAADDVDFLKNITFYIHSEHITNFASFMAFCASNNPEWFRAIAQRHTLYVKSLIDSERYTN